MAANRFRGDAIAKYRSENFTVGGSNTIGNVVGVVCNGKTVSYTTVGTETSAEIASALQALLAASSIPEFQEVTWTVNSTAVNGTDKVAGRDGTYTSTATGTNTLTKTTVQAATGPYHWNVAANWSLGSVPSTSDDVMIDLDNCQIKYGLDQSAVKVNSLTALGGKIGNLDFNGSYSEYREKDLKIQTQTLIVGDVFSGRGPSLFNVNLGNGSLSGASSIKIYATGQSPAQNVECVRIQGTHASNTLEVLSGVVGVAVRPGESATILTLQVGYVSNITSDVSLSMGSGCTIGTIKQRGGSSVYRSSITTRIDIDEGVAYFVGDSLAVPILNIQGGTVYYMGTGTITTLTVGTGGVFDVTKDLRSRTVTNGTLQAGSAYYDAMQTVTWTNPVRIECKLNELSAFDIGSNFLIQRS